MAGQDAVDGGQNERDALLADYMAAEDALRAFTDRNFGRMCAICARWTLFAARVNAGTAGAVGEPPAAPRHNETGADGEEPQDGHQVAQEHGPAGPVPAAIEWRLRSWVTNCCNANHALESMSESSLAGIVASRAEGRAWWRRVKRASSARCAALTEHGCYLSRGRPELCNRYFCEAVRDYLWMLGGAPLAQMLDEFQRRWSTLYHTYQQAIVPRDGATERRAAVRRRASWAGFFHFLAAFDQALARRQRPITAADLAQRLFKVEGAASLITPFFEREVAAIDGHIRQP